MTTVPLLMLSGVTGSL